MAFDPFPAAGSAGAFAAATAGKAPPAAEARIATGAPSRFLCVYPASAGYDLRRELDRLTHRALEANVFFSARFLAPAMPRLEDRQVSLMAIRDEDGPRRRLRFLMPFSVERPGFSFGAPRIVRAWASVFGPNGAPLVDAERAGETLGDLLETVGALRLSQVLVIPQVHVEGPFARLLKAVAASRDLPVATAEISDRPVLRSPLDGRRYLERSISARHMRESRRQRRRLGERGELRYEVARRPDPVRERLEEFLSLEASGWKGRRRTAMVCDRYRAAFAREAVNDLAEADNVRIHALHLGGEALASTIVLVMGGTACTWKTAYNEDFRAFSPGRLLMENLTATHLDDPDIVITDSCAVCDHPVMGRLWRERSPVGTLVVGLAPACARDVRRVAAHLHLYRGARNIARIARNRLRGMTGGR